MALFSVTYRYPHGSAEARATARPDHVAFLSALHDDGRLLVSGPTGDEDPPGALLVLVGDSAAEVAALLDPDPFALAGLVDREVREWRPVFGASRLS